MKTDPKAEAPASHEVGRHSEYAIDLAKRLANGRRPGILATVDEAGRPHLRWMATLSLHDFPLLYTITSPLSRKIEQINKNPNVTWMFSNDEMSVIVNIRGKARTETDESKMERVWTLLEDKSKAYFLSIAPDTSGFAVIETKIEDIECVAVKYDFRVFAKAADLESPQQ